MAGGEMWWVMVACGPMSEQIADPSAGDNGGFEVVRDGRPVQWHLYTPATVPTGDFSVASDAEVAAEGERSVRFDVRSASPEGGWRSPGLSQEWALAPGAYRVSWWVRGPGFAVRVGPVTTHGSDLIDVPPAAADGEWHAVEREVTLAAGERLRFEGNAVAPGTVWVDGVRVEPITPR